MKLKILAAFALLFSICNNAYSQPPAIQQRIPIMSDFNADTVGSFMYCVTTGTFNLANNPFRDSNIPIKTAGSSTTLTAFSAGTSPFLNLTAGDELSLSDGTYAYVVSKSTSDTVVINKAIDLTPTSTTGFPFSWKKRVCGTTATSGWFNVTRFSEFTLFFQADQGDASSLDATLECEILGGASAPNQIWLKNYLLATYGNANTGRTAFSVSSVRFDRCRIGVRLTDDASDVGVATEKVSAYVIGNVK